MKHYDVNITNLNQFINDKIPSDVYFNISFVTSEQVQSYIKALDPSKATRLDLKTRLEVFPILREEIHLIHQIIDLFLYYQPYEKYLKDMAMSI